MKKNKFIFGHDHVVMREEYSPNCEKGSGTTQSCDLYIPENIFHPETEKKLMPEIPLEEMHLARSLSSSLTGQMIKVLYVVQFLVKSEGFAKESKV